MGGLVTAAAALAQARRAVGLTQLLPANATVHTALLAAQRTVASMSGRRLVKVCYISGWSLGCAKGAVGQSAVLQTVWPGSSNSATICGVMPPQPAPTPKQVPRWARMPSELQQHWVLYTATSLASGYGAVFLFK